MCIVRRFCEKNNLLSLKNRHSAIFVLILLHVALALEHNASGFESWCYGSDRTFQTQQQVDEFAAEWSHCEALGFGLTFHRERDEDGMITNVDGFSAIRSVAFLRLRFRQNLGEGTPPPDLTGFASLTRIENHLEFSERSCLEGSLDGLSNLTEVGSLALTDHCITNIDFLSRVTQLSDYGSYIRENDALTNIQGLSGMRFVANLQVRGNPQLQTLRGLHNLQAVGSLLSITDNSSLNDCTALTNLLSWPEGPIDLNSGRVPEIGNNGQGCEEFMNLFIPKEPAISHFEAGDGEIVLYVSWADPQEFGGRPGRLEVACSIDDGVTVREELWIFDAEWFSPLTLTNLENFSEYVCSVTAINASGRSQPSLATPAIMPERLTGLPAWLLYEAARH